MSVTKLDHVNIRTANLERMIAFYEDVVGLRNGDRPPFPIPGAWLYCGAQAVVHLVSVDRETVAGADVSLEHFAFGAVDLQAFLANLESRGIQPRMARLPEWGHWQVNIFDPDGNHLHVDFAPEEQP